jgi:hypothetical protein
VRVFFRRHFVVGRGRGRKNAITLKTNVSKKYSLSFQPTPEQIRIAQILEFKGGAQDPTREKVIQLMEMTERSEEDACLALYECDNDVEQAAIYLLENLEIGSLVTNTKKKKNKSAQDGSGEGDEFESSNNHRDGGGRDEKRTRDGQRSSNRGRDGGGPGGRGRSRGGSSAPGQGGERDDNLRRGGARGRGGFSGRGRGRGTAGPGRGRDNRSNNTYRQHEPQEIDNWDPTTTSTQLDNNKADETWGDCGDWDNEEYTGSLSDTKVFTPSTQQDLSAPPGLEQQILNPPPNDYNTTSNAGSAGGAGNLGASQYSSTTTAAQQLRNALDMPSSVPLSAEQSQYFNTLGSGQGTATNAAYPSSVQYQYNDQQHAPRTQQQQQQQQQRSRARVPPPSKIPSSAVEMPDVDLPPFSLDVQFGALDFGTGTEESSYENRTGIETGDDYTKSTTASKNAANAGLGGLQASQLIQNSDAISSSTQADLTSGYASRNASAATATGQSALDQLTKQGDIYASTTTTGGAYQNLSYQTNQKGYQSTGYGANAYGATQTSNNYPASSTNAYGYNQNSYQQQSQGTQSGTGQQTSASTGTGNQNNSSG